MNGYPAPFFARGITRPECLIGEKIRSCVFDFDKWVRPDGNREMSIVWLIDRSSVDYALARVNQKGEIQFKLGFAVVSDADLDYLIKTNDGKISHIMDYEPHGLILSKLEKIELRRVSQHLAECAKYYPYGKEGSL